MRLASATGRLAAAVLLSAAARSGLAVMQQQSERIGATLGRLWWRSQRFVRNQERHRRLLLESPDDIVTLDGQDLSTQWFREYMRYDPAADLGSITCPVLAVTGRSDIQVDPGDVDRIGRAVRGEFMGHTPEHLTHLLRIDAGPPGLRTYQAQMHKPMDTGLLNIISAWLRTRLGV
jgi:pimeloyl-ACP methyl ester carboxylesterase